MLTVMMIAMKSYFLAFVFFLALLCLPTFISAQEDSSTPSSRSTQTLNDSSSRHPREQETLDIKHDPDEEEIPRIETEHLPRESDTFQAKFLNMLFLLGLLIGFMILASWALKRMMRTKMHQLNTASQIKVIETRYLSPRATLYLVEVQNHSFLIGESPTAMTYLATLPTEESLTEAPTASSFRPPPKFSNERARE
jgi:flagellar protein FliO/FliZ